MLHVEFLLELSLLDPLRVHFRMSTFQDFFKLRILVGRLSDGKVEIAVLHTHHTRVAPFQILVVLRETGTLRTVSAEFMALFQT